MIFIQYIGCKSKQKGRIISIFNKNKLQFEAKND
jgi:hypothetical protein